MEREKNIGRCFVAVIEGLGELCHNTETIISYNLIKCHLLYLGFVGSQERGQGEACNVDIEGVRAFFGLIFGILVVKGFPKYWDTEGRSQISEW